MTDTKMIRNRRQHKGKLSRDKAEPIAAVNRIIIRENGEPLVNVGEMCPRIIVENPPQWVRRRVAEMLNVAQSRMPAGHRLCVRVGWRSLEFQREIYWKVYRRFRQDHPEWPENVLRRQTNRYVAPPDAKAPPGHTTGGAVDVTVIGPDGKELDMTSPFGDFREGGYETFSKKVSPVALQNRKLLYRIMRAAGFSNCAAEWWHYSYGDSAWAVRTGTQTCCYGCTLPPSIDSSETEGNPT